MVEHSKSILYLFTNSYPYGNGYNWLDSELTLFQGHFKKVIIAPYSFEGNKNARQIPSYPNIRVLEPVLENDIEFNSVWELRKIISKRFFYYLREFLDEKVYSNSYWFKSWAQACIKTEFLLKSGVFKLLRQEKNINGSLLYFYWGNNQTLMAPFLKTLGYQKILVRFHGFDLYKERLGGYQPFRKPLLRSISLAAPISTFGSEYLKKEYPEIKFETKVLRLGVNSAGRAKRSKDGWLRIVSCSRIIRLKRIDLIPKILKLLPFSIEWTHIGDGDYMYLVENEIQDMPANIKINMAGWLHSDEVPVFYASNQFDLFISLSESEGIPVSIMEALAAGIPIFSTDVGGIREIVDEKVGCLVNAHASQSEISHVLMDFILRCLSNPDLYRGSAFKRYLDMCNKDLCDQLLLDALIN